MKQESKKRTKLTRFPLVSIIIPAHNEENTIAGTIESVLKLNYPRDKVEIIIINDGSTDDTKKNIEKITHSNRNRKIIFIDQKNQGKAKSLNNALKIAKGEFFACLDADSFVEKNTLIKMIKFYNQNPHLAIVTPAMRVKDPKTLTQKFQRLEYLASMFMARLMGLLDVVYVAPGPFSLYRSKIIKKLGGFDINNLTEDQEIAYRVQKHHYGIKQCYNAYVHTTAPHNIKGLYKQRNRWFKGSMINLYKYKQLFFNKKYGDFGMLQLPINLATYILSVCAIFFFGYFTFKPLFREIHNIYLINFDLLHYIRSIDFNFNILGLDLGMMFIAYTLFFAALIVFYLSHKNTDEKIRKHGIIYIIFYFFFYYTMLSVISVIVLIQLIFGVRQKW
ncbi:glycosyltransferase family 2 protein [Candidatus Woesearchaeota archaeon]|nr:glycosyltransferase family 2 protein [Candidatus Woesearchaeota archaeon]